MPWMIRNGITAAPSQAIIAPHNTTLYSQALSTPFFQCQAGRPSLRKRSRSRFQAERALNHTERGRNAQKLSPSRELAGSSGVATRT